MAEWVLVFTSPDLRPPELARLLALRAENRIVLSDDGDVLDVYRELEHVEVVRENTVSMLGEYNVGELAEILAAFPHPSVFRISYYRGTALLSETLHAILSLSGRAFIDNDHGVIKALDDVLTQGLRGFLAARGSRFSQP